MRTPCTIAAIHAGAGGLDLGFQRAGYRTLAACEPDPTTAATYRAAIPGSHPVTDGEITHARYTLPTPLGGIIGAPTHTDQVRDICDVVDDRHPVFVTLALPRDLGFGPRHQRDRAEWFEHLHALGYTTTMWLCDAADHGVAQRRLTAFLIATRHPDAARRLHSPALTDTPPTTVRQALRPLGNAGTRTNPATPGAPILLDPAPRLRSDPYRSELFLGSARALDLDRPAPPLTTMLGGLTTPIIDATWLRQRYAESWTARYYLQVARGYPPEGTVPARLRRLTVTEAGVLYGFAPDYPWQGDPADQYRQIATETPPALAYAVAHQVRLAHT